MAYYSLQINNSACDLFSVDMLMTSPDTNYVLNEHEDADGVNKNDGNGHFLWWYKWVSG